MPTGDATSSGSLRTFGQRDVCEQPTDITEVSHRVNMHSEYAHWHMLVTLSTDTPRTAGALGGQSVKVEIRV